MPKKLPEIEIKPDSPFDWDVLHRQEPVISMLGKKIPLMIRICSPPPDEFLKLAAKNAGNANGRKEIFI
jgi:hypothetical protein